MRSSTAIRAERGATIIEYLTLIALVGVALLPATEELNDRMRAKLDCAARAMAGDGCLTRLASLDFSTNGQGPHGSTDGGSSEDFGASGGGENDAVQAGDDPGRAASDSVMLLGGGTIETLEGDSGPTTN